MSSLQRWPVKICSYLNCIEKMILLKASHMSGITTLPRAATDDSVADAPRGVGPSRWGAPLGCRHASHSPAASKLRRRRSQAGSAPRLRTTSTILRSSLPLVDALRIPGRCGCTRMHRPARIEQNQENANSLAIFCTYLCRWDMVPRVSVRRCRGSTQAQSRAPTRLPGLMFPEVLADQ